MLMLSSEDRISLRNRFGGSSKSHPCDLASINVANKMKRKIELIFITDLHVIVWHFMYFFSLVGFFFPKTNMFILSFICPPRLVMYMDIRLDFPKLHACAVTVVVADLKHKQ